MKTVVSIPDRVFHAAEQLAARWGISRSELYAKALNAFLEKQNDQLIISRLNEIYGRDREGSSLDPALAVTQWHTLKRNS